MRMRRVIDQKPPLERVYRKLVNKFLRSLGEPVEELSQLGRYSYWGADLEFRGPWSAIEFEDAAQVEDAKTAIRLAREAHRQGKIRPFVVRLTPRNDPSIAQYLETETDWPPGTRIRPLRCEAVLCRDEECGGSREGAAQLEQISPSEERLAGFARLQLAGYGFGAPSPRDALTLGRMYWNWSQQEPDVLRFFVARMAGEVVGTVTVLPDYEERAIGLFGVAVRSDQRNRGVGRTLVMGAIEQVRQHPDLRGNSPRPPTIIALCDLGHYNERLFLTLGFRRAEIRPIYGGVPDWVLRERQRLRRLRWRMPP